MIKEIKWAWQRVFRGYDDRVTWGFDAYFLAVIPALKQFCEDKMREELYMRNNPERLVIYTQTHNLIEKYEVDTKAGGYINYPESAYTLLEYVGKHAGYYWD